MMLKLTYSLSGKGMPLGKHLYLGTLFFLCLLTSVSPILAQPCTSGVNGTVFTDYNANGSQDTYEVGVAGIQVTAYDDGGTAYGPVTTNANGEYTLPVDDNTQLRVEFTSIPLSMRPGPMGGGAGSTVAFVVAPRCNVNLGVYNPNDYCESNPRLAVPCYINGDPLAGGTAGNSDVLVAFPYNSIGQDVMPQHIANGNEIGSTWGVAYNKYTEKLFTTAFVKRHVGLGQLGTGGIYVTDFSGSTPTNTNFLDLTDFGIATGAIGSRDLPADLENPSADANAFGKVAKVGLGDIDISDDGNMLWTINLAEKELVSIDISTYNATGATPTASHINAVNIDNLTCSSDGDMRPFGVKYREGKVYIGIVCSGESSQQRSALQAAVYSYTPGTNNFVEEISFPLDFERGNLPPYADDPISQPPVSSCSYWEAWTDDYTKFHNSHLENGICYPQPVLSDIEFDVDGSMVLGFFDRAGHQLGRANYNPNGGTDFLGTGVAGGDILRVYNNNGTYQLENGGTTAGGGGCGTDNNGLGIGGGEYYCDDTGAGEESEAGMGGLALLLGSGNVVTSILNPYETMSGGIAWMNNQTGKVSRDYQLYADGPSFLGKAHGLGDVELLCGLAPIEVGDRIWADTNGNGIQDPNEPGIQGVNVQLFDALGNVVGQTTTDSDGVFTFSDLNPNTTYFIALSPDQFDPASGLTVNNIPFGALTTPNQGTGSNPDMNDSDAVGDANSGLFAIDNNNLPYIEFTTGAPGETNHDLDFGISPLASAPCPEYIQSVQLSASVICSGQDVEVTIQHLPNTGNLRILVNDGSVLPPVQLYEDGQTDATILLPNVSVTPNSTSTTVSIAFPANNSTSSIPYNFYVILAENNPNITDPGCLPRYHIPVSLKPTPIAQVSSNQSICSGQSTTLTASGGTSFNWSNNESGPNITVSPTQTTTYTVTVTNNHGCSDVASIVVTVTDPEVTVAAQPTAICTGESTTITATGQGNIVSYNWSNNETGSSFTVSPTQTTNYTVTVTDSNNCTATSSVTVQVEQRPSVTITQPGAYCMDEGVQQLTATPAGGTWGGVANAQGEINPSALGVGTHNVSYTYGTSANCTATDQITITVESLPTVSINPAGPYCSDEMMQQLTANPAGGTWGGVANAQGQVNPSVLGVGTHTVTYNYTTANGCANSAQTTITVQGPPTVSINPAGPYCLDEGMQTLTATPANGIWGGVANAQGQVNPSILGEGSHVVTYTYTDAVGCSSTTQATITVNNLPQPVISQNGPYCMDDGVQQLTASPAGGTWGGVANAQGEINPSALGIGSHNVTYTTVGSGNCSGSTQITIVVNPLPSVSITPSGPYCSQDGTAQLTATPAGGTWGGVANAQGQVSPATLGVGTHTVTYTYTDGSGCTNTSQSSITVSPQPTVSINPAGPYCLDDGMQTLTATPANGIWGGVANAQGQINPSILGEGTHSVTYTYTDANGCSNSDQMTFSVNDLPEPVISQSGPYCMDDGVQQLTASPAGGTWGGVANSQGQITPSTLGVGSHTVTYSTVGNSGCAGDTQITIVVNALPVVNIATPATPYCLDDGMQQLTATPAGGTWGGVANAQGQINPSILGVGTHTVTYTYTDGSGCTNNSQATITVSPQPTVSINPAGPYCLDEGMQTLTATPANGIWGGVANAQGQVNPAILGEGSHIVTYSYTDGSGCSSTTQTTIVVNNLPEPVITAVGPYCMDDGMQQLTASPAGGTWGGVANAQGQITPSALGVGSHVVTYTTVGNGNCSGSTQTTIIVNSLPVVNINPAGPYCMDDGVQQLTANPGNGTWGGVANAQGQITPSALGVGTHTVTYTHTDANGCTNSDQITITVNPDPSVSINPAGPYCLDDGMQTLTATPANGVWGGVANAQGQITPSALGEGSHIVSYTYTDAAGCSSTTQTTVVINNLPEPVITATGPYCMDDGVQQLTASPAGGTWGGVANAQGQITPSALGIGSHTVTYSTVGNSGCAGSTQFTIVVNPLPVVNITPAGPYCLDDGIQQLSANPGNGTWGGVANSQGQITPSALGVGTHTVTFTHTDSNGCTNSAQTTITVTAPPTVSINPAGPYCIDDSVQQLSATPSGGNWGGAANNDGQINPVLLGIGTYTVTYSYTDDNGCTRSDEITLEVQNLPEPNITPAGPYCVDAGVQQLTASPAGGTWAGGANAQGQIDPAALGVGSHIIGYTITGNSGCVGGSQITVVVNALPVVNIVTPSNTYCTNDGMQQLTANPTGGTWGGVANAQGQINPSALGVGTHVITYDYMDNNGCANSSQTTITVSPQPTVSINPAGPYCTDAGMQTVTATPAGGTWGGVANAQGQINPSALGAGTHTVTYTYTDGNGCSDSDQINITINNLPTPAINPSGPYCMDDANAQLTASPAGGTWGGVANAQGQINPSALGAGSHTVTYTVTGAAGCSGTTQTSIVVNPLPAVSINPMNTLCADAGMTQLSATPANGIWGGVANAQGQINPAVLGAGSHLVTYSYTDANGCSNSDQITITINPQPSVSINPTGPYCMDAGTQTLTATPAGGTWGGVANAQGQVTPSALGVGSHTVTYSYTDGSGCSNSTQTTIVVEALPTVSINPVNTLCADAGMTQLTASPAGGTWGGVANAQGQVDPATLGAGTHTVTYSYTDGNGCGNDAQISITVEALPAVSISPSGPYCADESMTQLTASPAGGTWGGVANAQGQVNPSVLGAGTHTVTYSFTTANGCSNSTQATITVNPQPSVNINPAGPYCMDAATQTLTASPAGGTWGGVANAQGQVNPSALGVGTHSVTYSYTDANGCSNSDQMTFTVNPQPTVSINPSGPYCADDGISQLTASPAGGTWGGVANAQGQITPSTLGAGSHTVTYSYTDGSGCSNSTQTTIVVNPLPAVSITPVSSYCADDAMQQLTASPTGGTWGGVANAQGQVTPGSLGAGSHTVTYSVTDNNGCTNMDQITIVINPLPVVNINPAGPYCLENGMQQLTANPAGGTWGGAANAQGQVNTTALGTGTHTVSYTYTDSNGCSNTTQTTIRINQASASVTVTSSLICLGSSTTLTATGGETYQWSTGQNGATISVNPSSTTTYTVTVTDTNGCSATASASVEVVSANAEAGDDQNICVGECATLEATGGVTYQWSNGENGASITVTPTQTTTYTVTVTDVNNCTDTDQVTVFVGSANVAASTPTPSICVGASATITATGSGNYVWSNGATGASITVNPEVTMTYTVTATGDMGCMAVDQVTISVSSAIADAGTDQIICEGSSASFTATGGISYAWSTGATGANITVTPTQSCETYTVTVTGEGGCTSVDHVSVVVGHARANAGVNRSICLGETAILTATGGASYQWSTGETSATISLAPTSTRDYTVTVTDANGCSDTDVVTVYVGSVTASIQDVAPICSGDCTNLVASGGVAYSWSDGQHGPDISVHPTQTTTYTVTVTDEYGCSETAQTTVTVQNCAQEVTLEAIDDNATTEENDPVTINPTGNDVSGTDVTVTPTSDPSNGTVTTNLDGTFTYTPNDGFSGTDQFTYELCDASGRCDEAVVIVTIQEAPNGGECSENITRCSKPLTPIQLCPEFCDLPNGQADYISSAHTTYNCSLKLLGGGCIQYTALPLFVGQETLTIVGCTDTQCDTVFVTINVQEEDCSDGLAQDDSPNIAQGDNSTGKQSSLAFEKDLNLSLTKTYPSPAQNYTNFHFTAPEGEVIVEVYSLAGALLNSNKIQAANGQNAYRLDVSNFATGQYIVRFSNAKTSVSAKMMKQ